MKNVTLAIDDDLLMRGRALAEARGTTLNALIRDHLQAMVADERRIAEAKAGMRRLIETSTLEFEPGADLKQLSRSRDPDMLSRHRHPDRGRSNEAG
jgi:predicted transcriptional regulator